MSPNFFHEAKELKKLGIKCGKNCKIHSTVIITHPQNLVLSNNVRIDSFTTIVNPQKVKIGNYIHIGSHVLMHAGAKKIILKNFSGISSGVKIFTHTDDYSGNDFYSCFNKSSKKTGKAKEIVLEKYCLIGTNSVVIPNTVFGVGATLAPLSFSATKLKPWHTYWGSPARILSKRKKDFLKKMKLT